MQRSQSVAAQQLLLLKLERWAMRPGRLQPGLEVGWPEAWEAFSVRFVA